MRIGRAGGRHLKEVRRTMLQLLDGVLGALLAAEGSRVPDRSRGPGGLAPAVMRLPFFVPALYRAPRVLATAPHRFATAI
jgi:hypothetical protein